MQTTLLQLRNDAYLKADLANDSGSIPTALATTYVNEAWRELYDLIVSMDDARIFAINAEVPVAVGRFSLRLPNDFYHLCSLHVRRGEDYLPAIAADPAQYAELAVASNRTPRGAPQYFLRENPTTGEDFVFLFPETPVADVAITYFPRPPVLQAPEDTIADKGGRAEFVSLGAAIRMLQKLDRDTSQIKDQQNEVRHRLHNAITNRDLNNPSQIRDIAYRFDSVGAFRR